MNDWNDIDLIEIIEYYAEENLDYCLVLDETDLSKRFDENVASHVIEQYGVDDEPAMSEAFSNWSDALCKDGVLHPEQYNQYEYVGRYA